jgi:hypothetical protein
MSRASSRRPSRPRTTAPTRGPGCLVQPALLASLNPAIVVVSLERDGRRRTCVGVRELACPRVGRQENARPGEALSITLCDVRSCSNPVQTGLGGRLREPCCPVILGVDSTRLVPVPDGPGHDAVRGTGRSGTDGSGCHLRQEPFVQAGQAPCAVHDALQWWSTPRTSVGTALLRSRPLPFTSKCDSGSYDSPVVGARKHVAELGVLLG